MLFEDVRKEILECAYFVAGTEAFFRSSKDTLVQRSADNAIQFLSYLDPSSPKPFIFSGTLNNPSTIVSLQWNGNTFDETTSIEFRYDGTWRAHWGRDDNRATCSGSDLDTLRHIGLPLVFKRTGAPRSEYGNPPSP